MDSGDAGSRFGVSLRHREPSSDSCSSAKEEPVTASIDMQRSPMSVDSDVPAVGSPLDPLPPPPLDTSDQPNSEPADLSRTPECLEELSERSNLAEQPDMNKLFKNVNQSMKEMLELKLVAEIKERADQKVRNSKEPSPNEQLTMGLVSHDPVAQLVSELSETMNLDSDIKSVKKIKESEAITYKSQLKKIEPPIKRPKDETNNSTGIIDFKSRLRKVESGTEQKKTEQKETEEECSVNEMEQSQESITSKRESTASSDSSGMLKIDEDDKRKSTGSISSLKKLWESKEASENSNIQLSPKLSLKNTKNERTVDSDNANESLEEESPLIRCASGRSTSGKWPPEERDKPLVPVKPVVKPVKPILTKPGPAIYATPVQPKPPILAKPNIDNKQEDSEVKITGLSERDSILEISQALESSLQSIRSSPTVSSATWLQLSDKIGLLHGSCMGYADSVVPAHTKFHFRELLTRLETQGRQLRSAGSRNISENTRQLTEVTNTLKDVVNAVKIF